MAKVVPVSDPRIVGIIFHEIDHLSLARYVFVSAAAFDGDRHTEFLGVRGDLD